MGGEIFKDSLRKLEDKPTQKSQKIISSETRENSQHSDINIIKNNTSLIMKIMSQRNNNNILKKKEDIDILFSRKITLEKKLLALIMNKYKNNNYKSNEDNNTKNITPNLKRNIIKDTENSKITDNVNSIHTNNKKFIPKHNETKNLVKYTLKYINYSGNLIKKDPKIKIKIKINTNTLGLNTFNYIFAIYIKIKSFNMFDPGINKKDPGDDEASTINFKNILDNFNLYDKKPNFKTNIMNNITYERKIRIFIDDVNYPVFIEICKLLAEDKIAKIDILKFQWSLFLSILELISGYKIYFNDKFGRLNITFENETINLRIPNKICTHSAYIEVISKRSNWDYLNDRARIHNIIINLNPKNINPSIWNETEEEEEEEFDEENFNVICDNL